MREFGAYISGSTVLHLFQVHAFKDDGFRPSDLNFFISRRQLQGNALLKWHSFLGEEGYELQNKIDISYPFGDVYGLYT